jgi:hypothetical protein
MGRPTDKQIVAWAREKASRKAGSCDCASTQLFLLSWGSYDAPKVKERVAVHIKEPGHARNHWALSATWAGDEEATIVDCTIGQFGGDVLVFVGTMQAWLSALEERIPMVPIDLDPGGKMYRQAFLVELTPDAAHFDDKPMLNFLPKKPLPDVHATEDDHILEIITAPTQRLRRNSSGVMNEVAIKPKGSRSCIIF